MEEGTTIINEYIVDTSLLESQNELIIEQLEKVTNFVQYQANQIHFFLVLLVVVLVTYFLYRIVKNFY